MDTVENTQNTKSKTVLVLSVGAIVGLCIGAGAVFFFFQDAVFFISPTTDTTTLSYPNPNDQKTPDLSQKINILLPKKLVSEEYSLLVNKIAEELRQVGVSNISTIIPLMDSIKQKSTARDFNGFFDLITQAKNEIKKNNDLLTVTRQDIVALKKVNTESIKDTDIRKQTDVLLASSDIFVQKFVDYFTILNETLSGSIPTQSLLDRLTAQVNSLREAGDSVQLEMKALLTLVEQKNK